MKIYEKPFTEKTNTPTHISQKSDGKYIIRHTKNNKTYYYGTYSSLDQATNIEKQIQNNQIKPLTTQTHKRKKTTFNPPHINIKTKIRLRQLKTKKTKKRKCKWCGRKYTPTTNNTKYCTNECRKNANNEKNRQRVRKHRQKYPNKTQIGTSNIGQHRQNNIQLEIKVIKKELNRVLR